MSIRSGCEELGFTKEEAVGKDFSDFLAPEYREGFAGFFARAKAAGGCKNRELEILQKDGTRITVSLKGKAVYDEAGSFSQMHCTFVNITKQKSLQEALQFSRNYLQHIFDSVPNIMIATDGRLIDNATPAMLEFFGYKTLADFNREHDCICDFFEEGKGLLQPVTEGVNWLEYILSRPDEVHKVHMMHKGKPHHFIVQAKPILLDQKKRSVVSLTDVTEFEKLRERLEVA
ncbi:MAG: PAS domain S-box protein, partial [Sulfurimonas sp.]